LAYHQPFQITGFHSCDKEIGLDILNGKYGLKSSINSWDWLGEGAYFWEQNPQRALSYAEDCAMGNQKFNGEIKTPFVIGAIIELGNCLNLLEPTSISIIKNAYASMKELFEILGDKMPVNKGPNRALDCAVIQYVHESNKQSKIAPYDTIRSSFNEGGQVYPTSNFTDKLHIEICVINPEQIKGYFLPRPIDEFNPYLNKEFLK
jgi:hypothetical protein